MLEPKVLCYMVALRSFLALLSVINDYGGQINSYGQKGPFDSANSAFPSPAQEHETFISPIPENILGIDILQSQTLQTCIGELLHQPVSLPLP